MSPLGRERLKKKAKTATGAQQRNKQPGLQWLASWLWHHVMYFTLRICTGFELPPPVVNAAFSTSISPTCWLFLPPSISQQTSQTGKRAPIWNQIKKLHHWWIIGRVISTCFDLNGKKRREGRELCGWILQQSLTRIREQAQISNYTTQLQETRSNIQNPQLPMLGGDFTKQKASSTSLNNGN